MLRRWEAESHRCSAWGQGGRKEQEGSNKPATGLQQACNMPATTARIRHCYGIARAPLGGQGRVPPARKPRSCAVRGPPRWVEWVGYDLPVARGCLAIARSLRIAARWPVLPSHLVTARNLPAPPSNFRSDRQHRIGATEGVLNRLPGGRIADPMVIDDKFILVASRGQPHRGFPGPLRIQAQGCPAAVPVIEGSRHCHRPGFRLVQGKFNRLFNWPLGGMRPFGCHGARHRDGLCMSRLHKYLKRLIGYIYKRIRGERLWGVYPS